MALRGKKILVGICGSIAAYKACELIRLIRKKGGEVYPVMTEEAFYFIHPITVQTLSQKPVSSKLFEEKKEKIPHLSLTQEVDLILVVPATANFISKVACGLGDDLLSTTILSTPRPCFFVPAMNHFMWLNPVFQKNVEKLKLLGYHFIGPEKGKLACGEEGWGRMKEPVEIVKVLEDFFTSRKDFEGKTFIVTAGPTREPLDRIRFLSNYSSGKMGYALAEEGVKRGARIILVSGPTSLTPPPGVEVYKVETALGLKKKVEEFFPLVQGVIMAAAVSDFRPLLGKEKKLKRGGRKRTLLLVENPDILKELGRKKEGKILVGFCAETENLIEEAKRKLKEKNLDLIVANDITQQGAGFEVDTNIVSIIDREGKVESLPKLPKAQVAKLIWDRIREILK